jgi:hypothetical protein
MDWPVLRIVFTMCSTCSATCGTVSRTDRPIWSSTEIPQISVKCRLICKYRQSGVRNASPIGAVSYGSCSSGGWSVICLSIQVDWTSPHPREADAPASLPPGLLKGAPWPSPFEPSSGSAMFPRAGRCDQARSPCRSKWSALGNAACFKRQDPACHRRASLRCRASHPPHFRGARRNWFPDRGSRECRPSLVLLCHKLRRMFRGNLRAQHGHRGSIRAIATTILQWTVAIGAGAVSARWLGRVESQAATSR